MQKFKFDNAEEFKEKVDEYFDVMNKCGRPYTLSGMAHYLGTNRMTLINTRNRNPEINEIIEEAKGRIEAYVEEQLFINNKTAGIIFNLKNNFHWKDQQEVSVNTNNQNLLAEMSTDEIKQLLSEETPYEVIGEETVE